MTRDHRHVRAAAPETRWPGLRCVRGIPLLITTALLLALATGVAWAYWSAGSATGGNGASAATTVNPGATPTASATDSEVTVSWAVSTLASGAPVAGYIIRRYDVATHTSQTVLSACTGTVAGTTCVEGGVPDGQWVYSVTPALGTNWRGTESAMSNQVTSVGPATKVGFTTNPSGAGGGTDFASQPVVAVQDAAGTTVTTSNAPVTLTITNPGGAILTCTTDPTDADSGVATFGGCSIDQEGTYTLTAATAGLISAVSTSLTITVGPAAQLAFTTDPSDSVSRTAFATQPAVTVQDAGGNTVTTSGAQVRLSITTPAGASLSCTTNPTNADSGVATFDSCSIDQEGSYTLTADAPGLTSADSASLTITVGSAAQLAFTTEPSGDLAGEAFLAQPVVAVQDLGGNTVTTSSASVTLTITTPAGATLTCTTNPVDAVAGVASFEGCSIDATGTYTLTADSAGLTIAVSASLTITVNKLAFSTNPSGAVSTTAFAIQPVVEIQDSGGTLVPTSGAPVTLTITTPAGATLTCTTNPVDAVAGVATFADCKIDKKGTYTLTAASAGLTSAISAVLTITAGPAAKVGFSTNPSGAVSTTALATQPVVAVQDASGNTVTTSSAPVTLTITTPAGATLTCTTNPSTAVSGLATFAACKIDKAGTYTLTASATALTSAVSANLTITVGTATKLAFTTNPSGSTGGTTFATQPKVTVQDAGGNTVTTSSALITMTITTAAGATLTCTTDPLNAASGVTSFAGCSINKAGTYTLTASGAGLTSGVSTTLTITVGTAAQLAVTTNPSGATGGVSFATQPSVTVQDAGANTVTTSTAPVTLSITTPAGATLTCITNPVTAVAGVATYAGCKIDKAGTYTLTAASAGLPGATSATLTITVGTATKLAFTTNPSGSTGGTDFATQPVVTAQDAGGNTVTTSSALVTLTITTPAGAVLACDANTVIAASGGAGFSGCAISKAGTYTLTAAATGLTSAVSTSLTIAVGPEAQLAFTTNPSGAVSTVDFAAQPAVTVQDAGANTVTTSSAPVTLTITTAAGAVLACDANTVNAASGVASFAGCAIDKKGTYTLTAATTGLTNGVSASLTITVGTATKLGFTTNPSGSTGGVSFATQPVVSVQDAGGNTTAGTNAVTLAITTPAGATLTCTTNPRSASAGLATFAACKISKAGTYTLTATATGLTSTVSTSLTITAGPATKLAFTTNPSGAVSTTALATQPAVTVQDAGANTVTTSSAPVTLTITTAAGAVLACDANTVNAASGVASFAGCAIDKKGTYTLTAATTGLTNGVSASLTITAGTATKLGFTTNPSGSTGGVSFATQPRVSVQDAGGNTTAGTNAVTLAITTPAGATLTCTTNPRSASAGLATFSACKINKAGTYTLTATATGLTSTVSTSLTITAGPATKLAFTTNPSGAVSTTALATQPVVTVQDAGANTVTTSSAPVTLTITAAAGATLTCTTNPVNAASGVASFAGCSIDKTGTYTLTAASTGITNAVSASMTITAGTATKLGFATNPSGATGGTAFATQPKVAIQDAIGNTTTGTNSVTLTITTPAGATLTCTANPVNAVAGLVTFAACKIDKPGTYTLTAAAAGLASAVSTSFTIAVGPATKLAFTTNPSGAVSSADFATQPAVTVQDAGANTVTTSSAPVTLTITTAAGANLACDANTVNAASGVASFAGCAIDKTGTYTLTAASTGLTNAVSASMTITVGTATKLGFTTNPSGAAGGTAFATQPKVAIQDAGGNTTAGTNSVTLTITTPAGATLTCTANPVSAVAGFATFAGCKIDKAGTYTLTAGATSLTSGVSASLTITAGAATKLAFTTSPSSTTVNAPFSAQPVVAVQDASGNTTIGTNAVTLTITTAAGATLTCSANPTSAVAGMATFSGCSIDKPGTYTLTAAATGLTSAVSVSVTIS